MQRTAVVVVVVVVVVGSSNKCFESTLAAASICRTEQVQGLRVDGVFQIPGKYRISGISLRLDGV